MMLKKGSGNKSGISVEGIYQSFILLKTRLINHSIGVKNNNFEEKKDVCLKDKERQGGFECKKREKIEKNEKD